MSFEDEKYNLDKEVAKRKERAKNLGIENIVFDLFFSSSQLAVFSTHRLRFLPAISNYSEFDESECKFTFNHKNFKITWKSVFKNLDIYVDNNLVLRMVMAKSYASPMIYCSDLEAFIEGDWILDLKKLIKEKQNSEENAERELKLNRINELKKNFGIE